MILFNENETIQDVSEFIANCSNSSSFDTFELYNLWVDKNSILFFDNKLVEIAISTINDLKSVNKELINSAYIVDKKNKIFK